MTGDAGSMPAGGMTAAVGCGGVDVTHGEREMVSGHENHDDDECPRCKLRRMLTRALTGRHRKRFASLLRYQLEDATRMVKAVGEIATVEAKDSFQHSKNSILVDTAVEELILACDRVYQVADGDENAPAGTMPAGRYWVGDLCYVLDAEDWSHLPCGDGLYELADGRTIAKFSTVHGDGTYGDDIGNEYAVDSGTIGCILAGDIRKPDAWTSGGAFVTSATSFAPRRLMPSGADAGVLLLAGVRVHLDDDDE